MSVSEEIVPGVWGVSLGIVNAFKRTLAKIAELDFDTAVFGHGTVLTGKANAAFRRFAEQHASA